VVPERKPFTSREITVTFGLRKLLIPAVVVIALAVVAIVIWRLVPSGERVLIPQDKPSLAVMYFENNTGNESLDIWSSALSDLLISDLSQSKYIRVLPKDRLFGILSQLNLLESKRYSSENLRDVAARGGASHILQGTLTKAGENFRINTTLQESSTMEIIGSDMVEGKGEESFHSMVDELTRRIKANFKLSTKEIESDLDKEVGKITTSSLEAYKYYSQGRDFHMNGDYRLSIPLMEKAIAIDPEFAMAYRSMASSYSNLGYYAERDKYLKKALELSERLSYKERYLIQGNYYYNAETYDKSLESFKKLLEVYPDDRDARIFLAFMYNQIEEWDKAIGQYEIAIEAGEQRMNPYVNFAGSYRNKGMYDKAKEILESYLANISENALIHLSLSYVYEHQGKLDLAMIEIDKAFSLSLNIARYKRQKGDLFLYKGEFINAEKEYQDLLEREETAANNQGGRGLSFLYLLQGKFEELIDQLKKGVDLAIKEDQKSWEGWYHSRLSYVYLITQNHKEALKEINKVGSIAVETESKSGQRNALYGKGLIYLEMGSIDEAQRAAVELKEMIKRGMNKKLTRLYYHLMGMIELKKNNYPKSIEYFKDSLSLQSGGPLAKPAINIDSLGLAYYRSGDLGKAREEYEKIARLTIGRINWGDIYAKSFYMLGKIYEQQDNRGKAIENYEKFLDLWKDADPGIVEVEDARKRLAGLRM
jgi:tetratricopeptide (TPR) repeat protein